MQLGADTKTTSHRHSQLHSTYNLYHFRDIYFVQPALLSQWLSVALGVELLSDYQVMSEICHKAITHTLLWLCLYKRAEALPWQVKTRPHMATNAQKSSPVLCLCVVLVCTDNVHWHHRQCSGKKKTPKKQESLYMCMHMLVRFFCVYHYTHDHLHLRAGLGPKQALMPGSVSRPRLLSAHDGSDTPDGSISNKHLWILIRALIESWLIPSNTADRQGASSVAVHLPG